MSPLPDISPLLREDGVRNANRFSEGIGEVDVARVGSLNKSTQAMRNIHHVLQLCSRKPGHNSVVVEKMVACFYTLQHIDNI